MRSRFLHQTVRLTWSFVSRGSSFFPTLTRPRAKCGGCWCLQDDLRLRAGAPSTRAPGLMPSRTPSDATAPMASAS